MEIIEYLRDKINQLVPDADFREENEDYDSIIWRDDRDMPSKEDVIAVNVDAVISNKQTEYELMSKINNRDLLLFKFIVQIIDVGLANSLWVASDFDEAVKDEYIYIKQKLSDLGLL